MEGESANSDTAFNANKGESVSIKHYNRLITELKCPGCASPMRAPILQCVTGHSICETCTKILQFCPLCEKEFSNLRSLTVEALCAKAHFNCFNSSNGCRVRLPIKLLDWHEQQCVYKSVRCFMGKVWGDCNFSCREIDWKEHIEERHKEKVFTSAPVDLTWDLKKSPGPLVAYYVIHLLEEMFYLYQVFDQSNRQALWTITHIPAQNGKTLKFAFEIEIYNPTDASKIICQRFPCHSESDKDILQEGTCVAVSMSDILRFVDEDKVLSYKVNIHEVNFQTKQQPVQRDVKTLPKDFQLTSIEGVNHKLVPSEIIVTRSAVAESSLNDSDDSDVELEMFVNQLVSSTPKLNFNRKFFTSKINLDEEISNNRTDETSSLIKFRSVADLNTSKRLNPMGRIAKSFMNLKVEFPDLRKIGKTRSSKDKF